jgi:hypothetical protein
VVFVASYGSSHSFSRRFGTFISNTFPYHNWVILADFLRTKAILTALKSAVSGANCSELQILVGFKSYEIVRI